MVVCRVKYRLDLKNGEVQRITCSCPRGCKNQVGFIYANDVCLMTSSEDDMKVIMEPVKDCVIEYGSKVNENKFQVVCIHGEVGRRRLMMGDCSIGEVEENKYIGITIVLCLL